VSFKRPYVDILNKIQEYYEPIVVLVNMNEKPDEKSESLKKDDTRVPPVQDFLSKPDLTACKVIQKHNFPNCHQLYVSHRLCNMHTNIHF
jgi:hypothetical protein